MAYVRSFLEEPDESLNAEEKQVRDVVEEFLKNVEDQKLDTSHTDYFSQVSS